MPKRNIIFKAKTSDGYYIKILSELLANNLKTGCFEFRKDGIFLHMMDNNRTTLIDLKLPADKFSVYTYNYHHEHMYVGLNLHHLHKMLKSIKKKDSMQFTIYGDSHTQLNIETIPKENTRKTTSKITIQEHQAFDIPNYDGYERPVIIYSSEFQKMCKDMVPIGKTINVNARKLKIVFSANAGEVFKRSVEFGEDDSDDDSEDEGDNDNDGEELNEYDHDFLTDQFTRISKLSGLSTTMQIYRKDELPLLFKTCIGTIGEISIFVKSKKQILQDNEEPQEQDDEDDDDE